MTNITFNEVDKRCGNCKYDDMTPLDHPCCRCRNGISPSRNEYENAPFLWEPVTNDPVNRPSHYTDGNIEVIDYIEDKKFGFHLGNAIKYISRAGKKNKDKEIEDLKKSIWYIERYIENIEEVNND